MVHYKVNSMFDFVCLLVKKTLNLAGKLSVSMLGFLGLYLSSGRVAGLVLDCGFNHLRPHCFFSHCLLDSCLFESDLKVQQFIKTNFVFLTTSQLSGIVVTSPAFST